jgi:hypothetical protein
MLLSPKKGGTCLWPRKLHADAAQALVANGEKRLSPSRAGCTADPKDRELLLSSRSLFIYYSIGKNRIVNYISIIEGFTVFSVAEQVAYCTRGLDGLNTFAVTFLEPELT